MRINSFLYIPVNYNDDGKNEWGESMGVTPEWSSPIPCHIKTNTDNRLGRYEDGVFHQASYNILTLPIGDPSVDINTINRVRIVRRGMELGEYNVISLEVIETQNRLQIVV